MAAHAARPLGEVDPRPLLSVVSTSTSRIDTVVRESRSYGVSSGTSPISISWRFILVTKIACELAVTHSYQ